VSQTAIFAVGIAMFALTIWGAVMAGSLWLAQVAEAENVRLPRPDAAPASIDLAVVEPVVAVVVPETVLP
jgi:hypothetical protein